MAKQFDPNKYKIENKNEENLFKDFREELVSDLENGFSAISTDLDDLYGQIEGIEIPEVPEIPEVTLDSIGAAAAEHDHDDVYAAIDHDHDDEYSKNDHSHSYADINDIPSEFTPSLHASSHSSDGTDPITPDDIGALSEGKDIDMKYQYKINNVSDLSFGTIDSDVDISILAMHPILDTDNNLVAIDFQDEYTGIEGQGVCLQNVAIPINDSDAANKTYVDSKILYSTSEPTEDDGEDGSIWIVYS